jgi:hypothetical protein
MLDAAGRHEGGRALVIAPIANVVQPLVQLRRSRHDGGERHRCEKQRSRANAEPLRCGAAKPRYHPAVLCGFRVPRAIFISRLPWTCRKVTALLLLCCRNRLVFGLP